MSNGIKPDFAKIDTGEMVARSTRADEQNFARALAEDVEYEPHATYLIRNQYGRKVEVRGHQVIKEVRLHGATLIGFVCHGPDWQEPQIKIKHNDLPPTEELPVVEGEAKSAREIDSAPMPINIPVEGQTKKKAKRKDGKATCSFVHDDGSPCKGIAVKGTDRCRHHPASQQGPKKKKMKLNSLSVPSDYTAIPKGKLKRGK